MLNRRLALIAAVALLGAGGLMATAGQAAPAKPRQVALEPADFSLGSPKAKVQLVEYASLSCPHCARFNSNVFPAFKAKYVDTGRVRYTLREMLTPPAEIAAAGFLLARCAGLARYFNVVDEVFRSQPRWSENENLKPIFVEIARNNGLTEARMDACLSNSASYEALNGRVKSALDAGISSTPTFFVNGKKIAEGEVTLDQLDAAIAAARKTGG